MIILADSKEEAKEIFIKTIRDYYRTKYDRHIELGIIVIDKLTEKGVASIKCHL